MKVIISTIIIMFCFINISLSQCLQDNPAAGHINLIIEYAYFGYALPSINPQNWPCSQYDYISFHTIHYSFSSFWYKVDQKKSQGHISGLTNDDGNSDRCPYHNLWSGGVPRSRHMYGNAADVAIKTTYNDVKAGFYYSEPHGGEPPTWCHIDDTLY